MWNLHRARYYAIYEHSKKKLRGAGPDQTGKEDGEVLIKQYVSSVELDCWKSSSLDAFGTNNCPNEHNLLLADKKI